MGEMNRKQYEEMMNNVPAKKHKHHNIATLIGSKSKALEGMKNIKPSSVKHTEKKSREIHSY